MKFITIFLTITLMLSACNDNDVETKEESANISVDIEIIVQNEDGYDLLDPENDTIDTDEINVYYKGDDGKITLLDNPNLDASKGYKIVPPEENGTENYVMILYLNLDGLDDNGINYTYVEWTDGDMDELKSEYYVSEISQIVQKVWVNGELGWEKSSESLVLTK